MHSPGKQPQQVEHELLGASAIEQAEAIARGEVSSPDLVALYLRRIEELNEVLNAFVTVDADRALADAREADRRARQTGAGELSLLHGIPIGIKDIVATAGMRTTFGSRAYADHVPDFDATTVRRMREAGMIVVGKTNTPEFAALPFTDSDLFGPCANPWDTEQNAGGSSGGAAAALAAGMIPISHGTDAGGSIRIPSAWCGVWGLKPSRGRVSLAPRAGERLAGIAVEGPMARDVRDLAALLDVMSGYEWGDPYWLAEPERPFLELVADDPGRLRVAVATESPLGTPVEGACLDAVDRAASLLSDLGHEVERRPFDWATDVIRENILAVWGTLNAYYRSPDPSLITEYNAKQGEQGRQMTAVQYVEARLQLEKMSRGVVGQWESMDLLLTPVTSIMPAPNAFISEVDFEAQVMRVVELVSFTRLCNITGQPALSAPLGISDAGLPVGVHLVGPPAGEAALLRVARQLEESLGRLQAPPLAGQAAKGVETAPSVTTVALQQAQKEE